jgi:hypothetical protein
VESPEGQDTPEQLAAAYRASGTTADPARRDDAESLVNGPRHLPRRAGWLELYDSGYAGRRSFRK